MTVTLTEATLHPSIHACPGPTAVPLARAEHHGPQHNNAELSMHPGLEALPSPLTEQLGTRSRLEWQQRLPEVQGMARDMLCRARDAEPYLLHAEDHGLTLLLQCLDPAALEGERQWGFQGFTLDASAWKGPWFDKEGPRQARAETLIEQLADSPDEVMHQHPMLCFAVRGQGGQTWSVVATFGHGTCYLQTFTLTRVSDWRTAAPVSETPPADAHVAPQEPDPRDGPAPACWSGARTPETGVWEGRMPSLHAQGPHVRSGPAPLCVQASGRADGRPGAAAAGRGAGGVDVVAGAVRSTPRRTI